MEDILEFTARRGTKAGSEGGVGGEEKEVQKKEEEVEKVRESEGE